MWVVRDQILLVWMLTLRSKLSVQIGSNAFVSLCPHQRQSSSPSHSLKPLLSGFVAVKWTSTNSEGSWAEQTRVRLVLWSLQCVAVRRVSWNNVNGFWKLSYPKSFLNEENGRASPCSLSNLQPLCSFPCPWYYQKALFFRQWTVQVLKAHLCRSPQADCDVLILSLQEDLKNGNKQSFEYIGWHII